MTIRENPIPVITIPTTVVVAMGKVNIEDDRSDGRYNSRKDHGSPTQGRDKDLNWEGASREKTTRSEPLIVHSNPETSLRALRRIYICADELSISGPDADCHLENNLETIIQEKVCSVFFMHEKAEHDSEVIGDLEGKDMDTSVVATLEVSGPSSPIPGLIPIQGGATGYDEEVNQLSSDKDMDTSVVATLEVNGPSSPIPGLIPIQEGATGYDEEVNQPSSDKDMDTSVVATFGGGATGYDEEVNQPSSGKDIDTSVVATLEVNGPSSPIPGLIPIQGGTAGCINEARVFGIKRKREVSLDPQATFKSKTAPGNLLSKITNFLTAGMEEYAVRIGNVLTFQNTNLHVFHVFTKATSQDIVKPDDLEDWPLVERLLKTIFCDSKYKITVCTNEIITPSLADRMRIIQESHESVPGGHQGFARATAANNLNQAKQTSKQYYDRYTKPYNYQVNEEVYLLKEPRLNKFEPYWTGPFKVIRILNKENVEICLGGNKTKITHSNKLKPA
ncbi:hypothetical protein KQX54_000035, partial [Cotesia glomerata]